MAGRELKRIEIGADPHLVALAEEVRRTSEPRVLQRENEDVALLMPLPRKKARSGPRGKLLTRDNALWNIVGSVHTEGPGDVAENKHRYLADAYYAEFNPPERG